MMRKKMLETPRVKTIAINSSVKNNTVIAFEYSGGVHEDSVKKA